MGRRFGLISEVARVFPWQPLVSWQSTVSRFRENKIYRAETFLSDVDMLNAFFA